MAMVAEVENHSLPSDAWISEGTGRSCEAWPCKPSSASKRSEATAVPSCSHAARLVAVIWSMPSAPCNHRSPSGRRTMPDTPRNAAPCAPRKVWKRPARYSATPFSPPAHIASPSRYSCSTVPTCRPSDAPSRLTAPARWPSATRLTVLSAWPSQTVPAPSIAMAVVSTVGRPDRPPFAIHFSPLRRNRPPPENEAHRSPERSCCSACGSSPSTGATTRVMLPSRARWCSSCSLPSHSVPSGAQWLAASAPFKITFFTPSAVKLRRSLT